MKPNLKFAVTKSGKIIRRFANKKEAVQYIDEQYKDNLGVPYAVEETHKNKRVEVVHRAFLKYAIDDPVWDAKPTLHQCEWLELSVIRQIAYDVTQGTLDKDMKATDVLTLREYPTALRVLNHRQFEDICQGAGIDPEYTRRKILQKREDTKHYAERKFKITPRAQKDFDFEN